MGQVSRTPEKNNRNADITILLTNLQGFGKAVNKRLRPTTTTSVLVKQIINYAVIERVFVCHS